MRVHDTAIKFIQQTTAEAYLSEPDYYKVR